MGRAMVEETIVQAPLGLSNPQYGWGFWYPPDFGIHPILVSIPGLEELV